MNKRVSRNGYTELAKSFAAVYAEHGPNTMLPPGNYAMGVFDAMVTATADMLERDSDRFDRDRFLKTIYCAKE